MNKIFYIIRDNGDGSSGLDFFDSEGTVRLALELDEKSQYPCYLDGDGGSWGELNFTGEFIACQYNPVMAAEAVRAQYEENEI